MSQEHEQNAQKASALLAGASGLIGQELLPLLLARPEYAKVHSLVRRETGKMQVKLREHVVDFAALDASVTQASVGAIDDVYITLGTTMKKAGSKEAFRRVDYDYILAVARVAKKLGAKRLALVSSLGASAQSNVFYNKTKGEAEDAILALGFEEVVIVRPSILDGDRQEERPGERVGLAVAKALSFMVPKKYQAIHVRKVAEAMVAAVLDDSAEKSRNGVRIIESDELQRR